jgi:hypothetical protein
MIREYILVTATYLFTLYRDRVLRKLILALVLEFGYLATNLQLSF